MVQVAAFVDPSVATKMTVQVCGTGWFVCCRVGLQNDGLQDEARRGRGSCQAAPVLPGSLMAHAQAHTAHLTRGVPPPPGSSICLGAPC